MIYTRYVAIYVHFSHLLYFYLPLNYMQQSRFPMDLNLLNYHTDFNVVSTKTIVKINMVTRAYYSTKSA